jgi:hypothetical protein
MLGLPPGTGRARAPRTGVVLGTAHGCLAADVSYSSRLRGSGAASPILFSYTLPNLAAAEVAIRYGATGPNLCLLAGPTSGLLAFYEAVHLVEERETEACIVLAADALAGAARALAARAPIPLPIASGEGRASALLIERAGPAPLARVYRDPGAAGEEVPVPGEAVAYLCRSLLEAPERRVRLPVPPGAGAEEPLVVEWPPR